jgi:hypothetical protein
MALASLTEGVSGGLSALNTSVYQRMQGQSTEQAAEFNSRMMELQAKDAIRRGDAKADQIASRSAQIRGAQKASYAAQGVAVDTGSPVDVASDTAYQAEQDMSQAKVDAWRESWGYKTQAEDTRNQGKLARLSGDASADATALTGGLRFASGALRSYGDWKGGQLTPKIGPQRSQEQSDAAFRSRKVVR